MIGDDIARAGAFSPDPKASAWDILFGQWRYRREVGGTEPIRKVRAFYAQRPRPWRWKGARA